MSYLTLFISLFTTFMLLSRPVSLDGFEICATFFPVQPDSKKDRKQGLKFIYARVYQWPNSQSSGLPTC